MVIDRFYFSNGKSAGSLEEFVSELKELDDECFCHHVTEDRNDFASWIEACVKDKVLARRVAKLKDKDKILVAIDKRMNTPSKVKKSIITQIKEAILDG